MKYVINPATKKELGFCNNSGCNVNACNDYSNNSCPGNVKVTVTVKC